MAARLGDFITCSSRSDVNWAQLGAMPRAMSWLALSAPPPAAATAAATESGGMRSLSGSKYTATARSRVSHLPAKSPTSPDFSVHQLLEVLLEEVVPARGGHVFGQRTPP